MYRDEGNSTAMVALQMARDAANRGRLDGCGVDDFSRGMYIGQLIIANVRLDANPLVVQAAENEIWFLCTDYVRRSA